MGDLDPKFRYFLAVLMLNMLILVIVSCLFSFAFDVQQVWYGPLPGVRLGPPRLDRAVAD